MSFIGELCSFKDCSVSNSPDGNRHQRHSLVEALVSKGHRVVCLQKKVGDSTIPGVEYSDGLPSGDVLYLEWRWKTYKGTTPDIARQEEILKKYHGEVPVLVFDNAYQVTADDELSWPKATIVDMCIEPRVLTRKRERLFFCCGFEEYFPCREPADLVNYGYVGNDYNRPTAFDQFYGYPSGLLRTFGVQTMVWGNWIDRSDARPEPRRVVEKFPYVAFCGRVSFKDSMRACNGFLATTHICMPVHEAHGNVTCRFTESMCTWTPGLVPTTFKDPEILGKQWSVEDSYDVVDKVKKLKDMTIEQRRSVVLEQKSALTSKYDVSVDSSVQFVESYIGKKS